MRRRSSGRNRRRSPAKAVGAPLRSVELAIGGDEGAFAELYSLHAGSIYNLVLRSIRNTTDAEDICQEVWLRVSREMGRLRNPEAFPTWLRRIATHLCIDAARGRKPSLRIFESIPDSSAGDPQESTARREEEEQLWQALASLTARQGIALYLREVEGYSYTQIADTLESTVSGIETLLFRARRSLAKSFRTMETSCEDPCRRVQTIMATILDGEGGPVERGLLDAHLAACANCRQEMDALRSASRGYAALPLMPNLALGTTALAGKVAAGASGASPFTLVLLKIKSLLAPALAGAAITAGIAVTTTTVVDFSAPSTAGSAPVQQPGPTGGQQPLTEAVTMPANEDHSAADAPSSPLPDAGEGASARSKLGGNSSASEGDPDRSSSGTTQDAGLGVSAAEAGELMSDSQAQGEPGGSQTGGQGIVVPDQVGVNLELGAVDVNFAAVDLSVDEAGVSATAGLDAGVGTVDAGLEAAVSASVGPGGVAADGAVSVSGGPGAVDGALGVNASLDDGLSVGADLSLGANAGGQTGSDVSTSVDLDAAASEVASAVQGVTSSPSSAASPPVSSSISASDEGTVGQVVDTVTSAPVVGAAGGSSGSTSAAPSNGGKDGKVSQTLGGLLR